MAENVIFVPFVSVIGAEWLFSLNVTRGSPLIGCDAVVLLFAGTASCILFLCSKNIVYDAWFAVGTAFLKVFVVVDCLRVLFSIFYRTVKWL